MWRYDTPLYMGAMAEMMRSRGASPAEAPRDLAQRQLVCAQRALDMAPGYHSASHSAFNAALQHCLGSSMTSDHLLARLALHMKYLTLILTPPLGSGPQAVVVPQAQRCTN